MVDFDIGGEEILRRARKQKAAKNKRPLGEKGISFKADKGSKKPGIKTSKAPNLVDRKKSK